MTFRRRVLSAAGWSAAQNWGSQLGSVIVFLILARLLEPADFGVVALASVYSAFVGMFVEQGFGNAIVQRAEVDRAHLDTAFWLTVGSGALLTLVSIAGADLIAAAFREPAAAPVIRWLSLGLVIAALGNVQRAVLQRELRYKDLAVRAAVSTFAGGVVAVILAVGGFGVWSLVAQTLVHSATSVLVLWTVSGWRPGLGVSRSHFHDLFGFGANLTAANVINFFNSRSDDLLIGYFLGATALGYYTVGYRLLRMMTTIFISVLSSVAFTAFSRIQEDLERVRRGFYEFVRYTSMVTIPVFVGMALVASDAVSLWLGPQWAPSIPVMQILAFIGIVHSVLYFHSAVILALGKTSWRLRLVIMNAVANVIVFLLVVRWGIVAVAAAYVIRAYMTLPVELWVMRKLIDLDLKTYFAQFATPVFATAWMALIVWATQLMLADASAAASLGASIVAGVVSYGLIVRFRDPGAWMAIMRLRTTP